MEIPVISRMNDFEASITSLSSNSSPSLISRLISIFQLQTRLLLWKWTPLVLALIYAFGTVARRVRILISHRRLRRRTTTTTKKLRDTLHDEEEEEEEEERDAVSSSEDDDDDEEEEEEEEDDERTASSNSCTSPRGDENGWDFRVAGSDFRDQKPIFNIRRRRSMTTTGADNLFSLADLVNGKSVVKLWDNFGLELDIDSSPPSSPFSGSFSILDLERDVAVGSVLGEVSMMSSPAVVLTARSGDGSTVGLSSWDTRLRRRKPAVEVEWRWTAAASGRPLGINAGGVDKVYVRGGDLAVEAIADLRKPVAPLDNVTEFDGDDTWWDAHAVIQTDG